MPFALRFRMYAQKSPSAKKMNSLPLILSIFVTLGLIIVSPPSSFAEGTSPCLSALGLEKVTNEINSIDLKSNVTSLASKALFKRDYRSSDAVKTWILENIDHPTSWLVEIKPSEKVAAKRAIVFLLKQETYPYAPIEIFDAKVVQYNSQEAITQVLAELNLNDIDVQVKSIGLKEQRTYGGQVKYLVVSPRSSSGVLSDSRAIEILRKAFR